MTTYNTGNPIGSTDPKDLYDNAQNLDALVNSTTDLSHADRLAVQRKTWHGMEVEFDAAQAERAGEFAQFLADSAYQDLGVYGAGIEVTRYNQVFLKDGEFYRAAASLGLPYTTTGLWASESGSFVGVGDAVLRQDLAEPGGSALVGFQQAGVGAVARSSQDKLRETVSITDFGAVGDGVTSDQDSVADAIASGFESVLVNDNGKFLVTSLTNPRGVELDGHGHIVKAITGGLQKLNSYSDKSQHVFGREYLAAFHNLLIAQSTSPTRKPIMVFSGDSTTEGAAVSADYQIHALLKTAAENSGLQTAYGINSINAGHSGWHTEMWRQWAIAPDMALNPDLYVIRWGINDPGYYSYDINNGPALDAGQSAPGRRTVDDFLTSLRAGLATIRASRSVASLSIVLMSPNSTADTPNGRDELWYEQIIPGIKQAARDFQCCFIDTYAYLRDSRPAAGVWMDDPMPGGGRGIHPLNVMNTWIAGLMADVIFPSGLKQKIGRTNLRSIGGAEDIGDATRPPSSYPYGITLSRANNANFPFDGQLQTVRWQDEVVVQHCYPYKDESTSSFAVRIGRAIALGAEPAGWDAWIYVGGTGLSESTGNVVPTANYALPAAGQMRAAKTGSMTVVEGYITKSTPSVIPADTHVATLPVGYRPVREAIYTLVQCWDGSGWESVRAVIGQDGSIATRQATTLGIVRIYINATFSQLA